MATLAELRACFAALMLMFASTRATPAQTTTASPDTPPADGAAAIAAQPSQPTTAATSASEAMVEFRAPLLREGTSLVEAVATLRRSPRGPNWTLHVQSVAATQPPYELIVLPSTRLGEMERITEAIGVDAATFIVTGRVFVFRDQNYALITHAAVAGSPSSTAPASLPAAASSADTIASDSAEALARSLEQQAGPIARSSGIARRQASAVSEVTASTPGLQENTVLVNRRGKITRDRGGGWVLVLDADATGLADPPLRLLPCMLLQGIEEYAQRTGNNSSIIITGQVYAYNGQNFLLPTVYRIPRDRSRITP